MNVLLAHGNVEWMMGGVVAFLGIMFFMVKIARGKLASAFFSALVWVFVFSLHKGSYAGIMTATLAALLFDIFGLPFMKYMAKR